MAWAIINDQNIVAGLHYGDLNDEEKNYGYVQVPDDVLCGMVRLKDGSFANPHDDDQPDIAPDGSVEDMKHEGTAE